MFPFPATCINRLLIAYNNRKFNVFWLITFAEPFGWIKKNWHRASRCCFHLRTLQACLLKTRRSASYWNISSDTKLYGKVVQCPIRKSCMKKCRYVSNTKLSIFFYYFDLLILQSDNFNIHSSFCYCGNNQKSQFSQHF